jgi:hypothetical protein
MSNGIQLQCKMPVWLQLITKNPQNAYKEAEHIQFNKLKTRDGAQHTFRA